jgi:hypothetical protein
LPVVVPLHLLNTKKFFVAGGVLFVTCDDFALSLYNMCVHVSPTTGQHLCDVLQSPLHDKWMAAMKKEFDTLVLNDKFDLVELPPGHRAVSTHWVLQIKDDSTFKACFIAHGFSQHEGVNY